MEQKVYVPLKLKLKLEDHIKESGGSVIGFLVALPVVKKNEVHITSAVTCTSTDPKVVSAEIQHALLSVPGGLYLCGVFFKCSKANMPAITKQVFNMVVPKDIEPCFGANYYIMAVDAENTENTTLYIKDGDSILNVKYTAVDDVMDSIKSCVMLRLQAAVPLSFEYSKLKDDLRFDIQAEFIQLENRLRSDVTAYHIQNSNVILLDTDLDNTPFSQEDCCQELFGVIEDVDDNVRKKKRKAGDFSQDVIHVSMLCQSSGKSAEKRTVGCAPLIHHEHKMFNQVKLQLPIDVALYMHSQETIAVLHNRLTESVVRQLHCMANYMLRNVKNMEDVRTPEPFHFCPPQLGHLITVVYPKGIAEESLSNTRKLLHRKLMLPEDRPYLRRLNAHIWSDEVPTGGYLLNVHEGLNNSGTGEVYTVCGRYSYHHYMQDRMNDDGWGCAYRSLQTLVSWFRFQGYTDKAIPTHTEIQQTLVDLGDKPEKIIGSKGWIGSVEVGMVLEKWIDVTSKILFVNSGADMSTKGRDLALHFQNHGTPVMIGGGVLAHTILGVDFNEVTGDVKFLILDPHYTGGEDLKIIQDKGWCGWKGCDFWDKNAHYNMCMPQRPTMI